MTILVTGSAGHLGEALMRTLQGSDSPARGIDLKPSPFTHATGSIADRNFVKTQMNDVRAVIHTATLHKPHVATHAYEDFVETNVKGTLVLLEEARAAGVECFIFTSTTSAFGAALSPNADEPAAWINEDVASVPKNIYGVTKVSAESLCELFHRRHGLPVLVLRTSRFFPEPDDSPAVRNSYDVPNAQAIELLYRRADIADIASAHLAALESAQRIGFARFIVSATTPFRRDDLGALRVDAPAVVHRLFPDSEQLFEEKGWAFFPAIDRVYDNARTRAALGWQPRYDFAYVLAALREGRDFRSPLAHAVGSKGYHDTVFVDGPYPVA
ncbi:MAG: NAD(P)-dependent oxidoreductase [Proteobacteria bacterium]|nr:NAD(P)-dependent oxidoreductase [Pseudomonadota bacterium]MDA1059848.1 NAD(P)-dependent oxidoreductase [Pseudomonadota bacterium]